MKKFLALLLSAMMLFGAVAFAEETAEIDTSDWQTKEITDMGISFQIPADMAEGQAASGTAAQWAASNEDMDIVITAVEDQVDSLADLVQPLTDKGFTVVENGLADAGVTYDHLCCTKADDENYGGFVFAGEDGKIYILDIEAKTDIGFEEAAFIFASIAAE